VTGVVLRVHQESEGVVQPGTPLLEVGDPTRLEVVVDLLTTDAVRVRPGAAVTLQRWGGEPFSGWVRRVEPSAFTRLSSLGVEEQRVNVIIDPEGEGWAGLGDGFRVEAEILVLETGDVTRVPASAVFRSGNGWAVFRVQDGRARLVQVEVGVRTPELVEVVAGVEPGDRVVVYPGDQVADGVRVEGR
jgi:HlyD family secretion protein